MLLCEQVGEAFHPCAHVRAESAASASSGEETAHQPREPCVVVGVTYDDHQLPQRRRTPQEQPRKPAQERRERSLHRIASRRRPVVEGVVLRLGAGRLHLRLSCGRGLHVEGARRAV